MKIEQCDLSVFLKEIHRLANETDFFLTPNEIKDYEEIKILGEILCEIEDPN